ncbi:MAG: 7-cyano-7-deazaguanine synthase [Desulfurococcales archaeon]|nr:7-cyano-7-deazaguanine synthase [Desulfurococcales archaeon]
MIHVLTLNYGQRASKEVDVAFKLVSLLKGMLPCEGWGSIVEYKLVDLSTLKSVWRGAQLTDESVRIEEEYATSVVVPVRNVVALSVAVAYAYTLSELYPGGSSLHYLRGTLVGSLLYETWSCYLSGEHHCGACESCRNRHKAFREAGIPDCTIYKEPPGDPSELERTGEYYVHKCCVEEFVSG